jgi:hypothetical protein
LLRVAGVDFVAYVRTQRKRNTLLMVPPMLIEAITAVWLLVTPLPHCAVFHALVLLVFVWFVTFWSIVPLHSKLSRDYDESAIRILVRDNWIRTICWTGRAGFMIWMTLGWITASRLQGH